MLLDTHVWVRWIEAGSNPLPLALIDAIERAPVVYLSAFSWWELAQLTKRGRLELPLPVDEWLIEATEGSGVLSVPISRRPDHGPQSRHASRPSSRSGRQDHHRYGARIGFGARIA